MEWSSFDIGRGINLGAIQGKPPSCQILTRHEWFYLAPEWFCYLIAQTIPYFFYSAHRVSLSVLTARDYWKIDR